MSSYVVAKQLIRDQLRSEGVGEACRGLPHLSQLVRFVLLELFLALFRLNRGREFGFVGFESSNHPLVLILRGAARLVSTGA
jgi:hypothetical protein